MKVGMQKSEVVEILRDPSKKFRYKGRDVWTYEYYRESRDEPYYKSIIFRNGKVVSIKNGDLESALNKSADNDDVEYEEYKDMIRTKKEKTSDKDFKNL